MNPASRDICSILEAAGLGLTFGTNLFAGKEPPLPDVCVTVFDIPGSAPSLVLEGAGGDYYPSIQVRVRHVSYPDGWALVHNVMDTLHGVHNETWGGSEYELIKASLEPFLLDYDENGRARFVADFNIHRR